jgi:uncharacterized membrane protein YidH (DUF202 family)
MSVAHRVVSRKRHVVLNHRMAQSPPTPEDLDETRRTSMAAERTWLAWWRTGLAATAGALAVGRLAPNLLDCSPAGASCSSC